MLLDFIKVTSEVMLKEIPNLLIIDVNYRCEDEIMKINIHLFDLNFKVKVFQFAYCIPGYMLDIENDLAFKFTRYLGEHVKPIFKNK